MTKKYTISYDRSEDKGTAFSVLDLRKDDDSIEQQIVRAVANGDYALADRIMDERKIEPTSIKVCGEGTGWKSQDTLFASIVGANQRSYSKELLFAVYQLLLQRNPEFLFSPSSPEGGNALHRCFEGKFVEAIFDDLIVKARDKANQARGLHVNAKDDGGRTPIFFATSPYAIQELDKEGANRNARNNLEQTALIYHSKRGDYHVLKTLLDLNYEVNAQDKFRKTALHYIMEAESPIRLASKIQLFMEKGADPFIEDENNIRPFCKANLGKIKKGYREKLQLFESQLQRRTSDYESIRNIYPDSHITNAEKERIERTARIMAISAQTFGTMISATNIAGDDKAKISVLSVYGQMVLFKTLRDRANTELKQFERLAPELERIDKSGSMDAVNSWVLNIHRDQFEDMNLSVEREGRV